jgi:hypothetical protein
VRPHVPQALAEFLWLEEHGVVLEPLQPCLNFLNRALERHHLSRGTLRRYFWLALLLLVTCMREVFV